MDTGSQICLLLVSVLSLGCICGFVFVPIWDEMRDNLWLIVVLFLSEIKEGWQWLAIWQTRVLISKLVEVGIQESYQRLWSL